MCVCECEGVENMRRRRRAICKERAYSCNIINYPFHSFILPVGSFIYSCHAPYSPTCLAICLSAQIKKRMLWKQAAALSVQRWQWHRAEEKRRLSSAEGAGGEGLLDADRLAAAAIDWSDFAVVETINFEPDELLPGEPGYVGGAPAPVPAPATVSMKSRTGTGAGLAAAVPPPPTAPTAPSYFAPQSVAEQPHGEAVGGEGEEEGVNVGGMEVEEEDISDLKVVSDYTYDIAATGGGGGGGSSASGRGAGVGAMVRDPISGKIVPAAELSEHMRVQLLDPQWREQQKRFEVGGRK